MPKVLKSHGEHVVSPSPAVSPLADNTAYRQVKKTVADENGNLKVELVVEPIIDDDNLSAEDFSLSNIIRSGSMGLLKPISPHAPSALSATDSVAAALNSLDPNNIVESKE